MINNVIFMVTLPELSFRPRDQHDSAFVKATAISLLTEGQNDSLKIKAGLKNHAVPEKDSNGQYDVLDGNARCEAVKLLINEGILVEEIEPLLQGGVILGPSAGVRSVTTQSGAEDRVFFPADFEFRAELALDALGTPLTREEVLLATCELRRGLSIREAVRSVKMIHDLRLSGLSRSAATKYLSIRFNLTKVTIRKYLWVYTIPQVDQDEFFNKTTTFGKLQQQYDRHGNPKPPKPPRVSPALDPVRQRVKRMWEVLSKGELPPELSKLGKVEARGALVALGEALGTPAVVEKPKKKAEKKAKKSALYTKPSGTGAGWVRVVRSVDVKKRGSSAFKGLVVKEGNTELDVGSRLVEVYPVEDSETDQHYEVRLVQLLKNGSTKLLVQVDNWNVEEAHVEFLNRCHEVLSGELRPRKTIEIKAKPTGKVVTQTTTTLQVKPQAVSTKEGYVKVMLDKLGENEMWWQLHTLRHESNGDISVDKTPLDASEEQALPLASVVARIDGETDQSRFYLVTEDGLVWQAEANGELDSYHQMAQLLNPVSGDLEEGYDASQVIPSALNTDFDFGD